MRRLCLALVASAAAWLPVSGGGSTYVPQDFAWTVTGTATETWSTTEVAYTPGQLSKSSNGNYLETVVAGMDGMATYEFDLTVVRTGFEGGTASIRIADATTWDWKTLFERFRSTSDTESTLRGKGTLPVVAGHSYAFEVQLHAGFNISSGRIAWKMPNRLRTTHFSAPRTAAAQGLGRVDASQGEINSGGFYAPPAALQGGNLSGHTHRLAWDNPRVRLVFSDTRSQTTGNPNAAILASTLAAPQMVQAPAAQTVTAGAALTWTVTATGEGPLSYQWLFRGEPITGATEASLRLDPVSVESAGDYALRLSNPLGSVTSDPVRLTVVPEPTAPPTLPSVRIDSVTLGGTRAFLEGRGGSPGAGFTLWSRDEVAGTGWITVGSGAFDPAGGFLVSVPVSAGTASQVWQLRAP